MNASPWGQPPQYLSPPPKKPSALAIVGIIGGGVLAFAVLIAFVAFLAKRQAQACDDAMARARAAVTQPVDGGDDTAATSAAKEATSKCGRISERAADVDALKAALTRRAELTKSVRARPAMLAAGYTKEQLARESMIPICRARGLYVVEMVASNVAGEPHYWDCEPDAVFGTMYLDARDCEARKLEHTTIVDESGNTVGVCRRPAPAVAEAPAGLMRIKSEGAWLGATTKAKLEKAVEIAASGDRAAFDRYTKTEPGVAIMAPRTEVILVELDGILFGPARVRRKGGTEEVWVLREALE